MICPHCKKGFVTRATPETIKRARALQKEGLSLRDIEKALFIEGYIVGFSTLSRHLSKKRRPYTGGSEK